MRGNIAKSALATLLVAALVVPAVAQEKAVKLATSSKKGDVSTMKMRIDTNIMGMDIVVTQTQVRTIKEVKENGDVVASNEVKEMKLSIGGMEMDQPDSGAVVETRTKLGKLVKLDLPDGQQGLSDPAVTKLSAMLSSILYTDKEVKANESWETVLDNPVVKDKKVKVKTTFLGAEKLDGEEAWKLKQSAEAEVGGDAKLTYEFTVFVTPKTLNLIKMEAKVQNLPTQFGAMNMTMKMNAIKPK